MCRYHTVFDRWQPATETFKEVFSWPLSALLHEMTYNWMILNAQKMYLHFKRIMQTENIKFFELGI